MRVKVGDLVSHTLDSGPIGTALVLSVKHPDEDRLIDNLVKCKFPGMSAPRWYRTNVLYIHGKD
jgi:hypothetical protein